MPKAFLITGFVDCSNHKAKKMPDMIKHVTESGTAIFSICIKKETAVEANREAIHYFLGESLPVLEIVTSEHSEEEENGYFLFGSMKKKPDF